MQYYHKGFRCTTHHSLVCLLEVIQGLLDTMHHERYDSYHYCIKPLQNFLWEIQKVAQLLLDKEIITIDLIDHLDHSKARRSTSGISEARRSSSSRRERRRAGGRINSRGNQTQWNDSWSCIQILNKVLRVTVTNLFRICYFFQWLLYITIFRIGPAEVEAKKIASKFSAPRAEPLYVQGNNNYR